MEMFIVKENDISRTQGKYRDLANRRILSNMDKRRRHVLMKKLYLADHELTSLTDGLKAATARYHNLRADKYVKTLERLVNDQKGVDKGIRSVRLEVEHLNSQINRIQQSRSKLEKTAVSDNLYAFKLKQANTEVRILENNLLVAQQKENHFKQDNVKLQQLIRDMCIDRIQFNKLWVRIVDRLYIDKKMLMDMANCAVQAFETGTAFRKRVDFASRNAFLMKFEQIDEMNAILRSLHLDTIREKFFDNKMHRIQIKVLDEKETTRRNAFRNIHGNLTNAFALTLNQVKLKSGRTSVDEIIDEFAKQKREYFSQYSYLNDLRLRVMQLGAVLVKVKKCNEIGKVDQVPIKQRNKSKMLLEASLAHAKIENKKKEDELNALNVSLGRYYQELNALVETMQCDRTKGLENDEIHVHNIGTFLSMMELRLKQVMSYVFYLEWRKSDHQIRSAKILQGVEVINCLLNELVQKPLVHQCAECAMDAEAASPDAQAPTDITALREAVLEKAVSPEVSCRMHNISQCDLRKSRTRSTKSMQR